MEGKNFDGWVKIKQQLDNAPPKQFKQGEIWWCAIGENIGVEINGKDKNFSRPVLIIKKLSQVGFIGLPLTSRPHQQNFWWYSGFKMVDSDKLSYAALSQVRTLSASRLYSRIGKISSSDLERVKIGFFKLCR